MAISRLRKLTDLFTVGLPVPLPDGSYLWVQALNAYQRDECVSDAQIARARFIVALKEEGNERTKIRAEYYEQGRERAIQALAKTKSGQKITSVIEDLRDDPDWKERVEIVLNSTRDDTAKPLTPEEISYLTRVNQEVLDEMARRERDETDLQQRRLHEMNDDDIVDEWLDVYLDTRATELATSEFQLTEALHATRYCSATVTDNGDFDHSGCESHGERVFRDRSQVKEIPERLLSLIQMTLADLNIGGRDPKDSASPTSSSNSSPMPSEEGESTPSTSTATPAPAPGT